MKKVIYKDFYHGYCVTDEANYKASISNVRAVQVCNGFASANEIIDYYCQYFKSKREDFIVIDK